MGDHRSSRSVIRPDHKTRTQVTPHSSGEAAADLTLHFGSEELQRFCNLIDRSLPEHLVVHIGWDSNSTHKTPSVQRWLVRCSSTPP